MGFTQVSFLFFFMPLCIVLYLAADKFAGKDKRICNAVLVCESLVFFWWAEAKLLLFFVVLTVLMYCLGTRIHKTTEKSEKKKLMICTVLIFALIPMIYKYLPALRFPDGEGQFAALPLFSDVLVPLGISFFALEAISYIADIYMNRMMLGSLLDAFVFMMLFPKAVCGPVVLWRDFSRQICERHTSLNDVGNGLKRIIIGYAKKAILADTFAASIVLIESKMTANSTDSLTVWLLAVLYFFRIYYDFSGYSDIAIGLSGIFGFDVGNNFSLPYLSASVTDFWRRWHISLGRWFREYVYIPLGGNRSGNLYINIFITFVIAGLWHGWRLPVLFWAALNGILVITEKAIQNKEWYQKCPRCIRIIMTIFIICLGWILFRAQDMTAAAEVFKGLFISPGGSYPNFTWQFFMTKRVTAFLLIAIACAFGLFQRLSELLRKTINTAAYEVFEKVILLILFAVSIMFVVGEPYTPFIYSSF